MADDPAELEAEQRARRVRGSARPPGSSCSGSSSNARSTPGIRNASVPARRAVHLQRDPARRSRGLPSAVAVAWLIEITSPPVSTTKFAWCVAVDRAAHRRQAVQPQRQLEVRRLRRQVLAERELVRLVVDDHRVAERQRRQALGLLDRHVAQRRVLDQARHVAQLQRAELERVDARELQAAQPDVADAGAERVGDRRDAEPLRRRCA